MIPRLLSLFLVIPWISVSAAQLDVAVLQFTELKSADDVGVVVLAQLVVMVLQV